MMRRLRHGDDSRAIESECRRDSEPRIVCDRCGSPDAVYCEPAGEALCQPCEITWDEWFAIEELDYAGDAMGDAD